jgi:Mn-containing catalase
MPPVSDKQRRYIYAQAAAGKPWARKFLKDSGLPLPDLRAHVNAAVRKHRK